MKGKNESNYELRPIGSIVPVFKSSSLDEVINVERQIIAEICLDIYLSNGITGKVQSTPELFKIYQIK